MTCARSVVLIGAAMLAVAAAVPGQAISQEAGIAGTSDLAGGLASPGEAIPSPGSASPGCGVEVNPLAVRNYGIGRTTIFRFDYEQDLQSGYVYRCAQEDLYFSGYRGVPYSTFDRLSRLSWYPWDGDYGEGRLDPSSPTSYTYPDTRFDLAAVLERYRAKNDARQVSSPPPSGGVTQQVSSPPSNGGIVPTKRILVLREPMGEMNELRAERVHLNTAPVVTRQIMEQRIIDGEMRRWQRANDGSARDASEKSERPSTPRSAAQRAARMRPARAAARSAPRPAASASSSAPSAAPAKSRSGSSVKSSSETRPQS